VIGELKLETLLRVCNPLQRSHGNLELTITGSAGAACRDGSKSFDDSKSALFHVFDGAAAQRFISKGTACRPSGRYDQKPLELVRSKVLSSGVTKVAVLKVAIRKSELDLIGLAVFLSNDEMRTDSIRDGDVNRSGYSGD
jgi:hypothetical protein